MILDNFLLTDQVALVTGAGRGIGAGIALAFAEAGADVVCLARTREQLEETAEKVRSLGRRALVIPCDVVDAAQRQSAMEAAMAEFGKLNILVNNVGGGRPTPALDTTEKQFDFTLRFNVTSAFALTQLAVPQMVRTTGGGVVINISSTAGRDVSPGFSAYGTAKAALSFLTQELAQDFAPKIRVNAIKPGAIRTSAMDAIAGTDILQDMARKTPLGRLGEVEDIAACALFLASPAASYITGGVFAVDGGITQSSLEFPRAVL
ncbi:MAG: glucose 1-dehydrogenase [Halieaceae bacterium]|jgi:7-alpha-hydroxysteroid dehydrogenase|nr:glucose 1-dehydrogenase [Halieaceae bacterium]